MEVKQDRLAKTLFISHKQMLTDLLERYHACLPLFTHASGSQGQDRESLQDLAQEKASVSDHKHFMKAVGSIQCIAAVTRPDIAYAAHALATHMAGSATKHSVAVQHAMRYLQSTIDVALTFNGLGNEPVVEAYTENRIDFLSCMASVFENCFKRTLWMAPASLKDNTMIIKHIKKPYAL